MADNADTSRKSLWRRWVPLGVLIALIAIAYAFDLHSYLSLDVVREHRQILLGYVTTHFLLSILIFMAVYAVATALSLPGGAVLTISGGFLFGTLEGTVYSVIGATVGATAVFLIARTSLGEPLRRKAGPWMKRMQAGFEEHAFTYLLAMRLVPVFPFFVVNLVPAFFGMALHRYVIATFIGIIPGALVFAVAGDGLGSVFDQGGTLTPGSVLTPKIIIALFGLAGLALLPIAYKKLRRRSKAAQEELPPID